MINAIFNLDSAVCVIRYFCHKEITAYLLQQAHKKQQTIDPVTDAIIRDLDAFNLLRNL